MKMIEPEGQLKACRLSAESAATAEPLARPSHSDSREVKIEFDWQIPGRVDSPIIFQVRISRHDQHSAISFAIDLSKLTGTDLQKLHDFLVERPTGYWLARETTWSLELSLAQQMPGLSEEDRHASARMVAVCGNLKHPWTRELLLYGQAR